MLHETLVYLLHDCGQAETAKLYELQDFLHPGEKTLFDNIMIIAGNYHEIVQFCKSIDNNEDPSKEGLYFKAFANGIILALKEYRKEIINLEKKLLEYPHLTLAYVYGTVENYQTLFNMLKTVIEMLTKDGSRGCLLIDKLHKYVYSGVRLISKAANIIIQTINVVFYRHLCNWIIYGNIIDLHNEFFICDGNCADENFTPPEVSSDTSGKLEKPPPVQKFFINKEMLPPFITEETADSILFMGRIVWIFHHAPKFKNGESKIQHDIWEGQEIEYYKKIQNLEKQSFHNAKFQQTIEECKLKITKYLWSVMLNEGNLKEHLQLIRDYYALGRGELFQEFIVLLENQRGHVPKVQSLFLEAARKIYGKSDKTYLRFEVKASEHIWKTLHLKFEIRWPLHIVFPPKSIELYNKLFSFLLRLSRTQIHLNQMWHSQTAGKQQIDRKVWTLRQNLLFLVNTLKYYFQVDVIEAQFSILLKAVENVNGFEDIVKIHHEFMSKLLSQTFVLMYDTTTSNQNKYGFHQEQTAQEVPSKVYTLVIRLLGLCDNFCISAKTWEIELNEANYNEVVQFQNQTDTLIETLFTTLYRLHEKSTGQHLLQLLNKLDFNRYFTKQKPDFNLSY